MMQKEPFLVAMPTSPEQLNVSETWLTVVRADSTGSERQVSLHIFQRCMYILVIKYH